MIFPRLASLAAIAVLLLLFTPGASRAPAAETDRVDARFEIFGFAGFHVLTNRTTIQEIGDRYAIAMDLDTRGLASVFVDLTSHSEVQWRARPGAQLVPKPIAPMSAETAPSGIMRSIIAATARVTNASTPASAGAALVVAAEQIRGTVDQLTAYFLIERQLAHRRLLRGGRSGLRRQRLLQSSLLRSEAGNAVGRRVSEIRRSGAGVPGRARGYRRQSGQERGHLSARQDLVCPRWRAIE